MSGAGAGAGAVGAAAAAANTAKKNDLSPRPLSFWVKQEAFLRAQLESRPVPNAANIVGLECAVNDEGRITFYQSAFEHLSYNTQQMRENIKKLTGDVPSYTQLLADQQDYFYPYFVMTPGAPIHDLKLELEMTHIDLKDLYSGKLDRLLPKKQTKDKVQQLMDQMRKGVLPRVLSLEDGGKPLCVYFFHTYAHELHALAGIFWKKDGIVYAGFYDTLYFERRGKTFDIYLGAIYIVWETLFREVMPPAKGEKQYRILNLSELCVDAGKGRHCVQYVMDAQYCSIYVFYFFYLYAKHNYPTDEAGIQQVIREAYVAKPEELRRDACAHTNLFRLTLIQFAMNTILLYTKNPARHVELVRVYDRVLEMSGYRLLTDDMYAIATGTTRGGGGRRYGGGYGGGYGGRRRKTARRYARRMQKRSRRIRR